MHLFVSFRADRRDGHVFQHMSRKNREREYVYLYIKTPIKTKALVRVNTVYAIYREGREAFKKKKSLFWEGSHLCARSEGCIQPGDVVYEPYQVNNDRKTCQRSGICSKNHWGTLDGRRINFPNCRLA